MKSRYSARHAGDRDSDGRRRRAARDRRRGRGAGTARRRLETTRHASSGCVGDALAPRRPRRSRSALRADLPGPSGTPAIASSTSSGRPCSSTRRSRGSSSVASSLSAANTKMGAPNGAGASIYAEAGCARPTSSAPRMRWPPTLPLTRDLRAERADASTRVEGLRERVRAVAGAAPGPEAA